ncbi:MAG: ankyrin repeat domain-containing protein [Synergistaceae bacterium]|nr:ankyrin repeat domain-containing protein [Synergistaceae bacterium]
MIAIFAGVWILAAGIILWAWTFSHALAPGQPENQQKKPPVLSNLDGNLFQAVRNDDLDAVRRCLREGADINAVDSTGGTPLKVAIALNKVSIVREMADAGNDASFKDGRNLPLVYAIVQNKPEITRELLRSIANTQDVVNAIDKNGFTPLMYAVERNHVAVAQELLKAGANVDKPNKEGYTPLMAAVTVGRADMVALLLKAGADTSAVSPEGETAMSLARRRNRQVIISLLSGTQRPQFL